MPTPSPAAFALTTLLCLAGVSIRAALFGAPGATSLAPPPASFAPISDSAGINSVVAPENAAETGLGTVADPTIDASTLQRVYEEVKTPYKYGIVLRGEPNQMVDCPTIFRQRGTWYMLYVGITNKVGYETFLAASEDLLHWRKLGRILSLPRRGWDAWQVDGGLALVNPTWGGDTALGQHNGKYWLSYIGGATPGYEPDPLSIGLAWTLDPTQPREWTRWTKNPVLTPCDPDVRSFERLTLYKSTIIRDPERRLGAAFVMAYNAKNKNGYERIGLATSEDLVTWKRHGTNCILANGEDKQRGISGDPQLVRLGDLWVMFYFGAHWQSKAFDTFAVSRDLLRWTKWEGPHLIAPSEPWDDTYAHKPWVLKHDGVVYHFYCAVGNEGRVIALATSRDLSGQRTTTTPSPVSAPATPPPAPAAPPSDLAAYPDMAAVPVDLIVPPVREGPPAPGGRYRQTTTGWVGTGVTHTLYLPTDWTPGKKYPVLIEYPGNGPYRNRWGDSSDGTVESCRLGYGLSGGRGYLWASMPFIAGTGADRRHTTQWWGDVAETKRYALATVRELCARWGGDASAVVFCGFSRGSIAANYLGLHDDEIAPLWRAFFCYSHYDGVLTSWRYPEADRAAALTRLRRLGDRPQFIIQEGTTLPTRTWLESTGLRGRWTFHDLPFRNHSADWVLRELPARQAARAWLAAVVAEPSPPGGAAKNAPPSDT